GEDRNTYVEDLYGLAKMWRQPSGAGEDRNRRRVERIGDAAVRGASPPELARFATGRPSRA
ncbi:hypothetical protein, partial [Saccharopolyspora sp. NPDC002686]|uniref:hypothetical protein n=1 Tax=Saccharopolyspora sp. NPDC002686 TaxID=3154541 RepID=UPI00331D7100